MRALLEGLRNALFVRDWSVVALDDDEDDLAIAAIPTRLVEGCDKVLATNLRKGQARRLARKLRQQREDKPEPIL